MLVALVIGDWVTGAEATRPPQPTISTNIAITTPLMAV